MGVAGLGDPALGPGSAGGVLRGDQAQIRADGVAGEAVPVTDFHREADGGQHRDAAQTHQGPNHRCIAARCRQVGDLGVQTVPAVQRQLRGLQAGLVGGLQGRVVEVLPVQPGWWASVQAWPPE
jgi:hypothetical protein